MTSTLRVAFAGTPEFAQIALAAIHQAGFPVVAVLSQPDRPAGRGMQLQASPVTQYAVTHGFAPILQPLLTGPTPGSSPPALGPK